VTRRPRALRTPGHDDRRRARRSWLRWPSALLPALLLTTTVGLSGGGLAGASSSSAPLVNITVTGAERPTQP
jgi:hypothetical protein